MTLLQRIKKLEYIIDTMIGYVPLSTNWRSEYYKRKYLIEQTLQAKAITQETKTQLQRVLDRLDGLYKKRQHQQGYIRYRQMEYAKQEKPHKIKAWRMVNGKKKYYYL